MASNFIIGLDIGTSAIKVAVAERRNGKPVLLSVFKEKTFGLKKGAIYDMPDALTSVTRALESIKKISKTALKNVYVNIGTPQVKIQSSKGFVAVSRADNEIYEEDMERVVKISQQSVNLGPNRIIAHNITREFIVDGVSDIQSPLGLSGNRLEVISLIVDVFEPHVKSLMRVVELAGAKIGGLVMSPLASTRAVLSKSQKDLGAAVVNLGAGTTGLCVYEENKLVGVSMFPVGAANITNDLAVGLKIPVAAAEILKLNYGYAMASEVSPKETIDLKKFSEEESGMISRRFVAEIIESRLAEIFEFVNNDLRILGKSGNLAGGVVLSGGGAKLPGITSLAKQELKLSSQIGLVLGDPWLRDGKDTFEEFLEDPEFVDVMGLLMWGADQEGWWSASTGIETPSKLKNVIKYFLP
jgi:cell division protein FtsA